MRMRFWAARLVLASLSLVLGVTVAGLNSAGTVLAGKTPSSSRSIRPQPITVSRSEFGVKKVDAQGKVSFLPTTKITLKEGEAYGWRIKLQNYQGKVKWREVLRLPKPPETWGTENSDGFSISADGTTATSERTQTSVNGVIENFWTIAPGDPPGQYQIQVYIDGRIITTFEFEIVAAK
ncbi:MAG TPA: hypothetical protein VK203_05265 [Nostocaceae cyanobacterium]|nr:hypothetical protein [Nostocaceae cyanobacterium]